MRKQAILLFLLPCFLLLDSRFCLSQSKVLDSLKLALKNARHDTIRCSILTALSETEPDDAIWPQYTAQLKVIAKKNLRLIRAGDPLYNCFSKHLATAYTNMTYLAEKNGNMPVALKNLDSALKIQNEIGNKEQVANCLNTIGYIYKNLGEIAKAENYYTQCLKVRKEMGDKPGIAESYNSFGIIYYQRGNIPKALDYYLKSLKMREEINDKKGVANSLYNIGSIYNYQGEVDKALECYTKSLVIQKALGFKKGIAYSLHNIAFICNKKGNVSKALEYYTECLRIREEIQDKKGIGETLDNLGTLYEKKGEPSKGLELYKKALKIQHEIGNLQGEAYSLNNIGDIYYSEKKYSLALEYGQKSMQAAHHLGFPENIKNAAALLRQVYAGLRDYKKSLENFELYILMRDSIVNADNKKASLKAQLNYEYEKRAAADSVKNAEEQKIKDAKLATQNATLKQEKFQRYTLYIGLLIVLGGLGFVINRFLVTNKQKKIIEEQKITVDEAFAKLHEKNNEVMDSIYYARKIQKALMTSEKYMTRVLREIRKNN